VTTPDENVVSTENSAASFVGADGTAVGHTPPERADQAKDRA
jgi:hypothetical protein